MLRREIDEIDRTLLDLLVRRVAIGCKVAAAKDSDSSPSRRPGREASIIRRLAKRDHAPLSVETIVRIWREILSANLSQQTTLTAALFAPNARIAMLAHDYCGSPTALTLHDAASPVLDAVADDRAQIGILPDPGSGQPDRWWPYLLTMMAARRPRVIARLPVVNCGQNKPAAIVIAAQDPESSGDDLTLFAVRRGTSALDGRIIDSWTGDEAWDLIETDGFTTGPDRQKDENTLWLGACARPVTA